MHLQTMDYVSHVSDGPYTSCLHGRHQLPSPTSVHDALLTREPSPASLTDHTAMLLMTVRQAAQLCMDGRMV